MTYVSAQPPMLAAAATDVAGIGSAIDAAAAAAAGPTTSVLEAAADEVSVAMAKLFGAYGQEFQAISARLAALQNQFAQALAAAGSAYSATEAANAAAVRAALNPAAQAPAAMAAADVALIMGGTGMPIPSPTYIADVVARYIPFAPDETIGLVTPEELYPITGVKSLTLQISVEEGLTILNDTLIPRLAAGDNVTVFGYSQSAVIASLEMQRLISEGAPYQSQLTFVLTGNEMNPNGGILARILGLNVSTIGLPFYGATPDNPYTTTTYTIQYDGFADFPRYPLNVLSDLNATMGILLLHTQYATLPPSDITNAVLLPTEGPTSNTYYMITTINGEPIDLPLLAPVRAIPVIGQPLAALVEPDLRVIVNLGYGDPRFGYSTSPANIPTPFGLFPDVPPQLVADALVAGTQQGVSDFMASLPAALSTPPEMPVIAFPPFIESVLPPPPVSVPPTPVNVVTVLASAVATSYSVLLPTADLGLAFVTILPAYDATLFVSELMKGDLVGAIELPLAATFGLAALGAMIEGIAVLEAAAEIVQDLQSIKL
ncbi:PE family protein [Mycobacterium lacus]|uniref:PE family protein PE1 n=1 Tax=Mycobacterium lacus TaxID=169765 RepID=A0A1X1XMY7_9MYCO|nr:PE-PPE domain-containing protein [Mycobacterium lacus]MCV7122053.1 PE-PPE domain-containing protein [Mycobacterium lacus]ORW00213.1 PE family protein [Mycobacterium lacus]BBX98775.1 PE family protein PE1 [Mycobacterium lacus]